MTFTGKSESIVSDEVAAGAAIYSNFVLSVYDIEVLMFELPVIFKCPLKSMRNYYASHLSDNHLEVGVGTGYFPSKALPKLVNPTIHLMDLNSNSLEKTTHRLRKYSPISHLHNVFDPIPGNLPLFKSIAAFNFFHCLPGTMLEKEVVITNLKQHLQKGGVFYGATVLGEGLKVGKLFEKTNAFYNKKGIFTNLKDNRKDLEYILMNNFSHFSVEIIGGLAFFYGHD